MMICRGWMMQLKIWIGDNLMRMLPTIHGYSTPVSNEEYHVYKKISPMMTDWSPRDETLLDALYKRGAVDKESGVYVKVGQYGSR